MVVFFALVDAIAGKEPEVEAALRREPRLTAVVRCKERSFDFLVRFEAPGFDKVDDVMQTYVSRITGVRGVEVVTDWDDYGEAARAARAEMK